MDEINLNTGKIITRSYFFEDEDIPRIETKVNEFLKSLETSNKKYQIIDFIPTSRERYIGMCLIIKYLV